MFKLETNLRINFWLSFISLILAFGVGVKNWLMFPIYGIIIISSMIFREKYTIYLIGGICLTIIRFIFTYNSSLVLDFGFYVDGWIHTVIGIISIVLVGFSYYKNRQILKHSN